MTSDVQELNRQVTVAIFRAELAAAGTPEEETALLYVSDLEERLAQLLPANELQGAVARVGAVTAAIDAGDWLRAKRLIEMYRINAPADLAEDLQELAMELVMAVP